MSDLQNMVRRIRGDLNRSTNALPDLRIREAITDAIKRFRPRRLGFNQKNSQTVLLSAQEIIALPTDWLEVDFLRLERGADRYPLNEVSYEWIEDRQRGQPSEGEPEKYAIQNRQLRFYPIPEQSYSLVMSFLCDLTEVSVSASDSATNAWMVEGEELVRKQAMGDLLVTYIGGARVIEGKAMLEEVDQVILPALEGKAAREQTSGKVRPFL